MVLCNGSKFAQSSSLLLFHQPRSFILPALDPDPTSSFASFFALTHSFINDLFPTTGAISAGIGALALIWLIIGCLASYARALLTLNGSVRDHLSEKGDSSSQRMLKLIEEKNVVQLTLRSIIVLLSVTFSVLGFDLYYITVQNSEASSISMALLGILAVTFVLVIASRIIPKVVAIRYALPYCLSLSSLITLLHRLFSPVSRPITKWFQKTLEYGIQVPRFLSGKDLKAMADIGEAHGTIEEDERELIHSIMDFGETAAHEVMVSRLDVQAISTQDSLTEALDLIQRTGHSRLPLYDQHLDNILGIIYVKDLLPYLASPNGMKAPTWSQIARRALFVPARKPLDDLLRVFQSRKLHLAIVVDEYGGTAGLVTMEDLLEEIVGDIRDEFDQAEEDLHKQIDESTHLFMAHINLQELCEVLNIELDIEKYDFDTLGGLIFHITGQVPRVGDSVTYENMAMRIESITNHRIGRVRISVQPSAEDKSLVA